MPPGAGFKCERECVGAAASPTSVRVSPAPAVSHARNLWVTTNDNHLIGDPTLAPSNSSFWQYSKFITPRSSMGEGPMIPTTYNFPWYQQRSLSCVGVSEFLATASLSYTVTMGIALPPLDIVAPLAIGGAIMCISNIVGDYSGAHMNPCVTLPTYLVERRFSFVRVLTYIIAQVVGGIVGVQLGYWTGASLKNPFSYAAHHEDNYSIWQMIACELVFTFFLSATVLKAAFMREEPNPFGLFWIVGAVIAGSYAGGPVSGACLNPALAIGFAVAGGAAFDLVPYILGPMLGALLSVGVIMFFEPDVYARRMGILTSGDWKERGTGVPSLLVDRLAILERVGGDEVEGTSHRNHLGLGGNGGASSSRSKRFIP